MRGARRTILAPVHTVYIRCAYRKRPSGYARRRKIWLNQAKGGVAERSNAAALKAGRRSAALTGQSSAFYLQTRLFPACHWTPPSMRSRTQSTGSEAFRAPPVCTRYVQAALSRRRDSRRAQPAGRAAERRNHTQEVSGFESA